MPVNRRKYPRLKIHVPVNYALLDGKGEIESELTGVALDISLGGLLLESADFVGNEYVGIEFIDMDKRPIKIKCKMAYSRKTDTGRVHTGLSFQGTETENLDFVTKIIRTYFYREKSLLHNNKLPTGCSDCVDEALDLIHFHFAERGKLDVG
jgi:c-di-GMP-binding flagellar brake protein YcgR